MVEFHYYYKDGNGFSLDGRKRYDGTVTEKDIDEIVRALDDGEYFIASQVGLKDIQPKMKASRPTPIMFGASSATSIPSSRTIPTTSSRMYPSY